MRAWENKLLRYTLTGGSAAVVDLVGFAWLSKLSFPTALVATLSFLVSNVVNYLLTCRFVFEAKIDLKRYRVFLIGSFFTLLLNVAITSVGAKFLSPHIFAKVIAIGLAFMLNFWINARLVFQDGPDVN